MNGGAHDVNKNEDFKPSLSLFKPYLSFPSCPNTLLHDMLVYCCVFLDSQSYFLKTCC